MLGGLASCNCSKILEFLKIYIVLFGAFLQGRAADLTLGSATKNNVLEKDCPQGSVMGPFVWNLIMNDLLCNISKFQNCHKIEFAASYCSVQAFSRCVHFVAKHS